MKAERNPRVAEPTSRIEIIRIHRAESTSRTESDKCVDQDPREERNLTLCAEADPPRAGQDPTRFDRIELSSQSESEMTSSQSESEMDPEVNVKAFPRVKTRRFPSKFRTVSQGHGGARAMAKGW